jgi:uncharacterized protein involved in type VI secretion and phage assembly
MAGYSQEEHILRIDTILNDDPAEATSDGDPLLLVKLDGVEGISRLSGYDVVMLRDAGGAQGDKRPPIDPAKLIDTHVEVGARPDKDKNFFKRSGMFETFEDILGIDIAHALPGWIGNVRDFHIYRARVVPWVKVLSRDICYRVFEKKTVVDIIDAIYGEAKKTYPKLKVDLSGLRNPPQPFPPMDYCVQFGESTLDFLFRIMARFGIWYYFGCTSGDDSFVLNDTLILRGQWDRQVPAASQSQVTIVDDNPDIGNIGKLVRRYRTPERRVAVGGFNYLDPTHPYYKDGAVDPAEDLLKAEGGSPSQTRWAGSIAFAEPVFTDSEAAASAKTAASQNQAEVFLLSCVTRNNTFASGYYFHIEKDQNFDASDAMKKPFVDIVDHDFIIDALTMTANDYTYISLPPNIPSGTLSDSVLKTVATLEADALDYSNIALLRTSLWATKTAEAKIYPAVNRNPALNPANPPAPGELFWTAEANVAAGLDVTAVGLVNSASLLGYSADLTQAIIDHRNIQAFAVGVIAVPAAAPVDLPLPLAARPVARGPHTAVVIGPDGTSTKQQDLYCDAIGRVRVRFPWDPGPPQGNGDLPPVFPFAQSDKPTTLGDNTCWVRVVEGWAGRHYGTQFLPRIGQEVLVDFLDGDPERPVITGRLYNADRTTTNLPFPDLSVKDTQLNKLTDLQSTVKSDPPLSGIKTWSIPTTDGDGKPQPTRFQLLRFSDKRDKEQYLIRSQGRLDITAYQSRYETIGSNRHLTVGGKKPGESIWGDYYGKVFRHYHLHVGDPAFPTQSGNRVTLLEQNEEIQVKKDSNQAIGGNWSTSVGGQATVHANGVGGTIVLNATTNVSLVVGESSIVITPVAIAITSPMVLINSSGPSPATPIDPRVDPPQEPKAADPGDTLTPLEDPGDPPSC